MITWRGLVGNLRTGRWAHGALCTIRRQLADGRIDDIVVTTPPAAPGAGRGVEAVLRAQRATCVEAALVRQRWLAARGVICDVVIGVTAPSAGFKAHAWLERVGAGPIGQPRQWQELKRLPWRAGRGKPPTGPSGQERAGVGPPSLINAIAQECRPLASSR